MGKIVTKEMFIQDIIQQHPETLNVFREFKLDCMNCQIAEFEDICHGAQVHHIDPDSLIDKLNSVISDKE